MFCLPRVAKKSYQVMDYIISFFFFDLSSLILYHFSFPMVFRLSQLTAAGGRIQMNEFEWHSLTLLLNSAVFDKYIFVLSPPN